MSIDYTALATGALGFTIALAWNDAVVKIIHSLFPTSGRAEARATFLYALVITILVIAIAVAINHCRRIVHYYVNGGCEDGKTKLLEVKGGSRSRPPPRAPDCGECEAHCGTQQLVRLWQPPISRAAGLGHRGRWGLGVAMDAPRDRPPGQSACDRVRAPLPAGGAMGKKAVLLFDAAAA